MKPNRSDPKNQQSSQRREEAFARKISRMTQRKLKAKRSRSEVWIGLKMFGLVGWAVSVPTLMGIAVGVWIDRQVESQYSWTLMFLLVGIALGCFNGWYWIEKESNRD